MVAPSLGWVNGADSYEPLLESYAKGVLLMIDTACKLKWVGLTRRVCVGLYDVVNPAHSQPR
jgi:Leu/Phe-tRNA-protein transferase